MRERDGERVSLSEKAVVIAFGIVIAVVSVIVTEVIVIATIVV